MKRVSWNRESVGAWLLRTIGLLVVVSISLPILSATLDGPEVADELSDLFAFGAALACALLIVLEVVASVKGEKLDLSTILLAFIGLIFFGWQLAT